MSKKSSGRLAREFLSTFDLCVEHLPSKKLHLLDYPGGENEFEQLRSSLRSLAEVELSPTLDDEPAATLVFIFLAEPKDLSAKVNLLSTYTSSEHPIVWLLLREKHHPRFREKIPAIWEPLSNAQYFEVRPTMKIGGEKWLGTRFTVGRGSQPLVEEKDLHMALPLSSQAQQRRSSLL